MVTYHNGDLLDSDCEYICHQCNLQSIFGGGIAYQIFKRYNKIQDYCMRFNNKLGDYVLYSPNSKVTVVNCYTQTEDFETEYNSLKRCFNNFKEELKQKHINNNCIKVGIPYKYGCGIANGDWNKVEMIFKEIFENEELIDFQIWKFEK